jgi:hypothetical protein
LSLAKSDTPSQVKNLDIYLQDFAGREIESFAIEKLKSGTQNPELFANAIFITLLNLDQRYLPSDEILLSATIPFC